MRGAHRNSLPPPPLLGFPIVLVGGGESPARASWPRARACRMAQVDLVSVTVPTSMGAADALTRSRRVGTGIRSWHAHTPSPRPEALVG